MAGDFRPPDSETPLDWALAYAAADMAVFPVGGHKRPLTEHGFKDAMTDGTAIRAWWRRWPHADIAWAVPADTVVVDLDVKKGLDGFGDFVAREGAHPDDVPTPQSSTPTGGRHLIYATNGATYANRARIDGSGIDTRAAGGYAVLPASNAGRAWLKPPTTPLAPAPAWLPVAEAPGAVRKTHAETPVSDTRLLAIARRVERALEGERNAVTFWAACRLAEFAVDERWAADLLALAATRAGLPQIEARRTIASAFRGQGRP